MEAGSRTHRETAREETHTLRVRTVRRTQLRDITRELAQLVRRQGMHSGSCILYVPHTTAGITINENSDPDVPRDIEAAMDRLVAKLGPFQHAEGNADAHVKCALTGVSVTVFLEEGRLSLGRWQGIFFCEFDGPREREVRVKLIPEPVPAPAS